ncbi:MAG: hypothetical protein L0219_22030 [Phycisphaerales bacterium]|nr:hypothetical protein [Phycisphaerales bacterium]
MPSSTTEHSKTPSASTSRYRLHPQSIDRITGVFGEHVGKLFELMIVGEMPRLQLDYVMESDEFTDLDLIPVITFSVHGVPNESTHR